MVRFELRQSVLLRGGLGLLGVLFAFLLVGLQTGLYGDNCPQKGQTCQIGCGCVTCFEQASSGGDVFNYIDGTCCRNIVSCASDNSKIPNNPFADRYQVAEEDNEQCAPQLNVDGTGNGCVITGMTIAGTTTGCGTQCLVFSSK